MPRILAPRAQIPALIKADAADRMRAVPDILLENKDHVATITLNRPDRLNAISGEMLNRLSEILLESDHDPDVRVILRYDFPAT